jgi:hypothetical protein
MVASVPGIVTNFDRPSLRVAKRPRGSRGPTELRFLEARRALPRRGRVTGGRALLLPEVASADLERRLATLSAGELVAALGLGRAPAFVRAAARAALTAVSVPLGRALARFDGRIESSGLATAAAAMLMDLGARWTRVGERPPHRGSLVVVANHPGAYDALVLLAAMARDDVSIVAADRAFLRAMPGLRRHLVFVPEGPPAALGRAMGLRQARAHVAAGGAVLHFGAGRIEPDPAFLARGEDPFAPWQAGTASLARGAARAAGVVVPAVVEGVHSPGAKRLCINRLAERRGMTTLAPLLQVAVPRYRDVEAVVGFGEAIPARRLAQESDARGAAMVRDAALALWPLSAPRRGPTPPGIAEGAPKRVDRSGPRG